MASIQQQEEMKALRAEVRELGGRLEAVERLLAGAERVDSTLRAPRPAALRRATVRKRRTANTPAREAETGAAS